MEEFKGNSNRSKEEAEDRVEKRPVVKGRVTVKKDTIGKKFSDVFLSDTVDNVKNYLLFDVIVPAVKDLVVDMISNGTNMLVYGNSSARSSRKRSGEKTSYTSYYRCSNKDKEEHRPVVRDRYGLKEIIFESRGDAKEVMDMLKELLDKFKIVSIADYYEISNAADLLDHTDRRYGWYELDDMSVIRDRDGYKIKLPRPEPLD